MEFNFSITRLLLFAAFLGAFAFADGFTPPSVTSESTLDPHRILRAWRYSVLLFVSGAVSASLIDHFAGTLDRSSIRPVYIFIGIALMVLACLWMKGLHDVTHLEATHAAVSQEVWV